MFIRDQGQKDALRATFKDENRALKNPSLATLTIVHPDGTVTARSGTVADPGELTIVSEGVWEFEQTWDDDGDWQWGWQGVGAVTTTGKTTVRVRPYL